MYVEGSSHEDKLEVVARLREQYRAHGPKNGAPRFGKSDEIPEEAAASTPPTEDARGVVRLLQEGHFRGVADVRLRINFAEELQGIQSAATDETLRSGLSALQEDFNATIDAFVEGGALGEEELGELRAAQEGFNTRIATLLEGDKGELDEDVFGELRTAFQDFLQSLTPPQAEEETTEVFTPTSSTAPSSEIIVPTLYKEAAPEPSEIVVPPLYKEAAPEPSEIIDPPLYKEATPAPGEITEPPLDVAPTPASSVGNVETVPDPVLATAEESTTTGEASTSDVFAGLRETLTSFFDDFIANLQASVESLGLPPLSEPQGNGRAYEQFLAAYNEIFGTAETGDGESATAPLDTIT